MITCFEKIKDKKTATFISFDICDFYPSITDQLLEKALIFAFNFTSITEEEKYIIKHTKRSSLYNNNTPWAKKSSGFDVKMGSFDGAETCELIGLFLLSQLEHVNIDVGLYGDDGLATCTLPPKQAEATKKEICKIFKCNKLNKTIEANKKSTNFLDLTLNLKSNIHKKPNSSVSYTSKHSNHPQSIIKNLPKGINNRLIHKLKKNEEVFKQASPTHNNALKRSAFDETLHYNDDIKSVHVNKEKNSKQRRKITWFNTPFNMNVKTNFSRNFLNLIDKHFPKTNMIHKTIN